jgi:hypothetical protein
MKTVILHDEHGAIISISKVGNLTAAGSKFTSAGMVPGPGQKMLEVELSPDDEKRTLTELHTAYRVDVASSKLVKS